MPHISLEDHNGYVHFLIGLTSVKNFGTRERMEN